MTNLNAPLLFFFFTIMKAFDTIKRIHIQNPELDILSELLNLQKFLCPPINN